MDHSVKVGASHTPSQTHLPLTSRSPRTHRWVPSHSPTVSCAYRAAGWRQPLPTRSPSMPSSARAAAPACRRAEALEVRYRAAAGVGEEAHSRQRHWCPWSKPVNVETWGHVSGPIVMAHALAELRYGIVAHQHESGFKCGYISAQTLYKLTTQAPRPVGRAACTPRLLATFGFRTCCCSALSPATPRYPSDA